MCFRLYFGSMTELHTALLKMCWYRRAVPSLRYVVPEIIGTAKEITMGYFGHAELSKIRSTSSSPSSKVNDIRYTI